MRYILCFAFAVFWLLIGMKCIADTIYVQSDVVTLSYSRVPNGSPVTGLSPTVTITNAKTNATLLASTAMTESAVGSGVYTYQWTHGLNADTPCIVKYVAGSRTVYEFIQISVDGQGGRAF